MMKWGMVASQLKQTFLEWMYPNRCPFCQELLEEEWSECCNLCYNRLTQLTESYCSRCGKPIEAEESQCYDCDRLTHAYKQGRSLYLYEATIKHSLLGLKFQGRTWIGLKFGNMMRDFYSEQNLWIVDAIIPVPLHFIRYLGRGYNQAEILARPMADAFGIPVYTNVLYRLRYTKPQKFLDDEERQKNMCDAFRIPSRRQSVIRGKRILLIDDIYTTGATIDACARTLQENGAAEVYFMTMAIGGGIQ